MRKSNNTMMVWALLLVGLAIAEVTATRGNLRLVVHLARVNDEALIEAEFVARSYPESSMFRQFMTHAELRELVAAKEESASAVFTYLMQSGARQVRFLRTGDAIACVINADYAARLGYVEGLERQSVSMPFAIAEHVRHAVIVAPRKASSAPRKAATSWSSSSSAGSSSSGQPGMDLTPASIRARYAVPSKTPVVPSNFTQGVAEFEGEYFYDSDISAFCSRFGLKNVSIPVMGPMTPSANADATEGTLDLEYISAMSGGNIPTWWLAQNTDNNDPGNIDFTLWCDQVLALSPMPYVVSLSWGMGVQRYVKDLKVLESDNDAFRKMGLMGVSVFAASGDSGPGVRSEQDNCKTFTPSWPASCPYLTSVGATYALSASSDEISVNWSGGGFSTMFARPAYQDAAVMKYFKVAEKELPKKSFYNASGRGYPDVSALGANFEVIVGGQWGPVSGTSASSPTFAGIVALIVGERLASGQSPLGFLNPTLYQLGKVGFDVTQGKSLDTNCNRGTLPGFPAAVGWDAVSGLGTPNYEFLRQNL